MKTLFDTHLAMTSGDAGVTAGAIGGHVVRMVADARPGAGETQTPALPVRCAR